MTPSMTRPLFALLTVLAASGCNQSPADAGTPALRVENGAVTLKPDGPQWKYVQLATAELGAPLTPLPIPARVELNTTRTANIGAPLAGRVETVSIRLGERVKVDARLFSVRSGAFAELARELDATSAQVDVRRRLVERAQELLTLSVGSQKDVLAAQAELKEAELAFKAAQAKRQSLRVGSESESLYWVRAHQAGTVVQLEVFAGQEVTPDREGPLVRLSDLSEVVVLADVPEADVGEVSLGEVVNITSAAGGQPREGVIEAISDLVDPRRRSVEVRVRVTNTDRALRPNAYVEVVVRPETGRQVLKLPEAAVVTRGAKHVVFIVDDKGRLVPTPVTLGRHRDGSVEARSGLTPGQRFVASGALLLLNELQLAGEE